ncbi:MAG TPA: hypothetical protein VFJ90_15375 [Candidatus Didemnitutus sp.]|nr:hypothetical protein [Candidatus Didemnitutus sp.]
MGIAQKQNAIGPAGQPIQLGAFSPGRLQVHRHCAEMNFPLVNFMNLNGHIASALIGAASLSSVVVVSAAIGAPRGF